MPQPFRTTRLVEFVDTDMAGIAHFTAFFRYMEAAEHALLRGLGLSIHRVHEALDPGAAALLDDGASISFPRVSARCDYRSPARCEDVLDIEVVVARLGTTSVAYAFRFRRDGRELASGEMTSVCCLLRPGESPQAIPVPAEIATKLRAHLAPGDAAG